VYNDIVLLYCLAQAVAVDCDPRSRRDGAINGHDRGVTVSIDAAMLECSAMEAGTADGGGGAVGIPR